ncbi:transposase [Streptomyces vinaceus]
MAELAKRKLRSKIPQLTEALVGRFREHHAFLTRLYLDQHDQLNAMVDKLTERIEEAMAPFRPALDPLTTVSGISRIVADVIIAETGRDMDRFPTAGHLASWAGVCPGHHESAGRTKNTRVRPGNPYLKGALGVAALSASRSKDTYLAACFKRLAARRGAMKAVVALEHSIITSIWHMLTDRKPYHDLGGAYFAQRDPERATRRAITQLNQLGYTVTLNPMETAAWPNSDQPPGSHNSHRAPAMPTPTLTCCYLRVRIPSRCAAAVEAGKWARVRPERRFHCDACELARQDGVWGPLTGTVDCCSSTRTRFFSPVVPPDGAHGRRCPGRGSWTYCTSGVPRWISAGRISKPVYAPRIRAAGVPADRRSVRSRP